MGRRSRGCLLLCLLPCLLGVCYLVCWMSVTLPVGCPLPCLLGVRYRGALSSDSRRGQRGPFLSAAAAGRRLPCLQGQLRNAVSCMRRQAWRLYWKPQSSQPGIPVGGPRQPNISAAPRGSQGKPLATAKAHEHVTRYAACLLYPYYITGASYGD